MFAPNPGAGTGVRAGSRPHAEFLLEQVAQTPDVTLAELQALLFERGVAVGIGTVWRFFDRHQIS